MTLGKPKHFDWDGGWLLLVGFLIIVTLLACGCASVLHEPGDSYKLKAAKTTARVVLGIATLGAHEGAVQQADRDRRCLESLQPLMGKNHSDVEAAFGEPDDQFELDVTLVVWRYYLETKVESDLDGLGFTELTVFNFWIDHGAVSKIDVSNCEFDVSKR